MPLLRLLQLGEKHPYLWDQGQEYDFSHFKQKVAQILGWLRHRPVGRYAIWSQDPLLLGAGLFALWHHGSSGLLLPDGQAETIKQGVTASLGLLSDEPQSPLEKPFLNLHQIPSTSESASEIKWQALDPEQPAVSLFTSGSTGQAKEIQKKLSHLNEEIKVLESRFGSEMNQTLVTSSVYGFHLYGLLFRLLWPLAVHRPFSRQTIFMPEDLEKSLQEHPRQCFISGPAILKRFCEFSWLKKQPSPRLVFSSGGPLACEVSNQWEAIFGQHPIEILGSTETGGIAEKSFKQNPPSWKIFDSVLIDRNEEGQLLVRSPFFGSMEDAPFVMGDRVQLIGPGEFRLLGRIDRIVKIEEKRVNLVEMEQHLQAHEEVESVVLLESQRVWPSKKRQSILAVLQLKNGGLEPGEAKKEMNQRMKQYLSAWYPALVLPRYWRYLGEIPLGPAGKPDYQALCRMLAEEP